MSFVINYYYIQLPKNVFSLLSSFHGKTYICVHVLCVCVLSWMYQSQGRSRYRYKYIFVYVINWFWEFQDVIYCLDIFCFSGCFLLLHLYRTKPMCTCVGRCILVDQCIHVGLARRCLANLLQKQPFDLYMFWLMDTMSCKTI